VIFLPKLAEYSFFFTVDPVRMDLRLSTLRGMKQGREIVCHGDSPWVCVKKLHWAVWCDLNLCLPTLF